MDYQKLVEDIIKPLISSPDELVVNINQSGRGIEIDIRAEQTDIAKIIGFKGNVINAIREVIGIAGKKEKKYIRVNVLNGQAD